MDMDGSSDRPRLTSEQKKKNHIESEKKRREAIRAGFERLSQIIPGAEGQSRSESVVLQKTVKYLKDQLERKEELKERADRQGVSDGEFEKIYNDVEKAVKAGEYEDADGIKEEED
ncbi:Transcription factor [Saxophila tyrrhenica]|uniref:Transcription factor n=1 Tax=Saxophila tyrrhenica TaxID=1690608 RepID=A0AAV9PFA8_9PEZI|nr:Transcription factor [Saxophila tyrrhenica]